MLYHCQQPTLLPKHEETNNNDDDDCTKNVDVDVDHNDDNNDDDDDLVPFVLITPSTLIADAANALEQLRMT
jgi:hypothetical protein